MKAYIGPYCDSGDDNDRKISIEIHPYDSWNADHTIGLIALPILKQLKVTKSGSPITDDEDVPDELKGVSTFEEANENDSDLIHRKWAWIMDEIIFAFEHLVNKDWEEDYYIKDDTQEFEFRFNAEGYKLIADRIQNGFRLFGKYYQDLWD